MHVKKGDIVEVIAGRHKGKRGKIIAVLTDKQRVRVEGVNIVKKHVKRTGQKNEEGIIEKFGTIHISKVLPIDPKQDKPTRVGFDRGKDGRKVRVCKRSGETLA